MNIRTKERKTWIDGIIDSTDWHDHKIGPFIVKLRTFFLFDSDIMVKTAVCVCVHNVQRTMYIFIFYVLLDGSSIQ